jgi:hypothetical protein
MNEITGECNGECLEKASKTQNSIEKNSLSNDNKLKDDDNGFWYTSFSD